MEECVPPVVTVNDKDEAFFTNFDQRVIIWKQSLRRIFFNRTQKHSHHVIKTFDECEKGIIKFKNKQKMINEI